MFLRAGSGSRTGSTRSGSTSLESSLLDVGASTEASPTARPAWRQACDCALSSPHGQIDASLRDRTGNHGDREVERLDLLPADLEYRPS